MVNENGDQLRELLTKWANPPKELVGKLPRRTKNGGSVSLDYMGHAAVTRVLIETDPFWTWEPVAWNDDGVPRIGVHGNRLVLWGRLTVLGKTVLAVGTCETSKMEPEKELVGDLLRNGAMRFGIGLSLWAKEEWHMSSDDGPPARSAKKPRDQRPAEAPAPAPAAPAPAAPAPAAEPETAQPVVADPGTGPSARDKAKALRLAMTICREKGVPFPSDYDALVESTIWPEVQAALGSVA